MSDRAANTTPPGLSAETAEAVLAFRDARGWKPRHNAKDLAVSISVEAAELLENFQWSGEDLECAERRAAVADELADVLIYALLLADRLGVSPDRIVREKLARAAEKYPVRACLEDPSAAGYAAVRARSRAEAAARAELLAALADPQLKVLLDFREFLRTRPVGAWTSASDGRVFFVAYERPAVAFWTAAEAFARHFPAEALARALPEDFPRRPDPEAVRALSLAGLAALLARIVRDERMHDGAFLSAAESGLLGVALEALDAAVRAARGE